MSFLDWFRRDGASRGEPVAEIRAQVTGTVDSPEFYEALRAELSGTSVTVDQAMRNTAVFRAVNLISSSIGMLPLTLRRETASGEVEEATDHPLFRLLMRRPNDWQSPYEFKQLMQTWALVHGNAYALIVRGFGGRVVAINPIPPGRVTVRQMPDWSLRYRVATLDGRSNEYGARDVLHLRAMSLNGEVGLSRVSKAADVISAHIALRRAAERMLTQGQFVGGALKHPKRLSEEAAERLRLSMEKRHAGTENAGRWMVLQEGMEAVPFKDTAVDGQFVELGQTFVEEVGRIFDVPRPFLGVDDTSWGSGIEQLSIMFVNGGLAPWFAAWEDQIRLKCVPENEWDTIYPDFDERQLLRGTLKDQAEFYSKALGASGRAKWMTENEVRRDVGLGRMDGGDSLAIQGDQANVAAQPA